MSRVRARSARAALAALFIASPAAAVAQGAASPRVVEGRIVRPTPAGEEGVPGVVATLHRVGPDRSGPVDSVRAGAGGRFAFRYLPTGSEDAIYFVSASHHGIAYFGLPLRAARVTGDDADITVFDTTSTPVPLQIRGRHVVVSSSDAGSQRGIVEVFELSNETTRTLVGGLGDSATFRVPVPPGATQFQGGQGDVPPDAIALVDGRAEVYAPIAPGVKQLSFSYVLPRESFPLGISLGTDTELLEVLLEDSTGTADAPGLVRQGVVESSGRTFVRWLAEDVPGSAVLSVNFPSLGGLAASEGRRLWQFAMVAVLLAAASLAVLRVTARRRGLYAAPAGASAGPDPERLAARIAALDAAFERRRGATDAERAAYLAERDRLKAELTDALAARAGGA